MTSDKKKKDSFFTQHKYILYMLIKQFFFFENISKIPNNNITRERNITTENFPSVDYTLQSTNKQKTLLSTFSTAAFNIKFQL